MGTGTHGGLAWETRVDVTAMAELVRALVAGGASRLQDAEWLRGRAEAVGLGSHELEALEALRARLRAGRQLLPDDIALTWL